MKSATGSFKLYFLGLWLMIGALVIGCNEDAVEPQSSPDIAGPPQWQDNYPSTKNGASSVDINVKINQSGDVFYVLFDAPWSDASPENIRRIVEEGENADGLVDQQSTSITSVGEEYIFTSDTLVEQSKYYIYLTAISYNDTSEFLQPASQMYEKMVELEVRQQELQYESNPDVGDGKVHAYTLYKPEAYYKSEDEQPLLIFLHGSGERGNLDYKKLTAHGPPKLVKKGWEFDFIVAAPQLPSGDWKPNIVDEFYELLVKDLRVDKSKVYITGLSLGGMGTFRYAIAHPEKVTAIVPMAGANKSNICNMIEVPVWAFHNENDNVVSSQQTKDAIAALKDCNPGTSVEPLMEIYPVSGHDSWTKTYDLRNGHDIYSWMLQYSK